MRSTNVQGFVDEHSNEPTAKSTLMNKLWWVAKSYPPAVFDSIICRSNVAKNAACERIEHWAIT
jgi:hypothetical protein